MALAEVDGRAQCLIGQHDTLRRTGGSGGVVDYIQVIPVVGIVGNVLPRESHRIFLCKPLGYGSKRLPYLLVRHIKKRKVIDTYDSLQARHGPDIQLCPYIIVSHKDKALRMIYKMIYTFRSEV